MYIDRSFVLVVSQTRRHDPENEDDTSLWLTAGCAPPALHQIAYTDARDKYHKLHIQIFLMINTSMFETCRRHYN